MLESVVVWFWRWLSCRWRLVWALLRLCFDLHWLWWVAEILFLSMVYFGEYVECGRFEERFCGRLFLLFL